MNEYQMLWAKCYATILAGLAQVPSKHGWDHLREVARRETDEAMKLAKNYNET